MTIDLPTIATGLALIGLSVVYLAMQVAWW